MKSICIKILIALNIVFWPILRFDIRLEDGERISVSGFPVPWYSSSVMGTTDVNVSILFLLVNIAIYFSMVHVLLGKSLEKFFNSKKIKLIFTVALVFLLLPPFFNLASQMILGDWSGFVIIPWSGWNGKIDSIYLSHGMASFNSL